MSDHASQFVGNIPHHYDAKLGPHIFSGFAADLTRRIIAANPANTLEIAAGTGILTRMLRDALPEAANLIASDLNPPMIEIARAKFQAGERIEFHQADATALPFGDNVFDAVACQFGVMFFPDKPASYREVHRTLRPGGRYVFNVWDSLDVNPFAQITRTTVSGFFAGDAPGFYDVPFGYHDAPKIRAALKAAGFSEISNHVVALESEIPIARRFAEGLILGNPVIDEIRSRGCVDAETVIAALEDALHQTFGADPGRMPLQAILFEARKPA